MKRKLNNNELQILKSIYFHTIDYNKVELTNQHLFSKILKKYRGIVFDNTIVFTNKSYKYDFSKTISDMALLVHEICHIWQYQNLNYRWYKAGVEHLKFGKSTYSYNIADHKKLTDFRFEQQGEIMADYFRLKKRSSSKISIYEDVIYSTINKNK
ncbi:MAG: hypothetical protein L3J35_01770 [Bacteroidales bacterium]|nr:hypothetical protein [Bacteroidales bacterium]